MKIILPLLIGIALSPVAGLMAFLITYHEYQRHYADKQQPLRIAFEAALFTFTFFIIVSLIIGLILNRVYQ
jgi:K+-sensing histidine kinase KdpD